ncbi:MAG TPA: hypothetical protein VMU95_02580 [Trebonia sp.]|nr:hypothetical protein [Trebonia sp.]
MRISCQADWSRNAWLVPAALAVALIGLLCWGAWRYGYDPRWLTDSGWRPVLRTSQNWTILTAAGLLFTGLGGYWWPRRTQRLPIGLIVVVVLVIVAAVLGTASYVPCRGQVSTVGVSFWILQMYVGQPPDIYQGTSPAAGCAGPPPLALQLGQIDGLGATLIGAIAVGSMLWRQPIDRLQSRFVKDAIVFSGLSTLTLPLLRRLTEQARSPREVIVIEPDQDNAALDEARLTNARIVIGDPASPQLLHPIIATWRGCGLSHLYALRDKVQENDAIIQTAEVILSRYQPAPDRQPHLVALIDDPRQADHWRGRHSGRSGVWFEDALSPAEATARGLVPRVLRSQPRQLLICGDSTLTLAVLLELARWAWEQAEMLKAAAAGRALTPELPRGKDEPVPFPLAHVALLDLRAADIRREYLASGPAAILESLPPLDARPVRWREELLHSLDAMHPAEAKQVAVIITEDPPGSGVHEAGRVARLHPETPVFVLAPDEADRGVAIFDHLYPYEPGILVDGEVPEDTWTRVARHWHECYRLSHPLPASHPRSKARVPWTELDPFVRKDNILELRSILAATAAFGRQWTPVHLVPAGSVIELSEEELNRIAISEHTRWQRRQVAAGRVHEHAVPWPDLPSWLRTEVREHLRTQLAQLEDVGFVPIVPAGGPSGAAVYERVGIVQASKLTAPLVWTTYAGERMQGQAGDWRVVDQAGNVRTVTEEDFQSSHESLGRGRWRRVGRYRAWPVREDVVVRTKEGKATACAGDWIVEAPTGDRWPVRVRQFEMTYRPVQDSAALSIPAGRESTEAGEDSRTAPASLP